jgi:hypothetical protein
MRGMRWATAHGALGRAAMETPKHRTRVQSPAHLPHHRTTYRGAAAVVHGAFRNCTPVPPTRLRLRPRGPHALHPVNRHVARRMLVLVRAELLQPAKGAWDVWEAVRKGGWLRRDSG